MTKIHTSIVTCALYARVSTEEQNPEKQVKELIQYVKKCNYRLYKVYTDRVSGTRSSRPALMEMLKDAHEKKFNVIITWKLDRLGRSLQHLIKVTNYLQKWDIDFICATQNIDTTTSGGKLVFHIMGAMAEFERDLISERTKMGLKNARNVGRRGKDKKPRRKSGYYLRYQKKGTPLFFDFDKE